MMDGAAFCPYCGQRTAQAEQPVYEAEVKRPLKPAGRLIVYPDRTEFVTSSVQKTVFHYTGLVAVKKGLLDTIEFLTEDGGAESCPADRRCVHEALVHIEQAARPYLARRKERLLAQGVRYSFPSNQGLMSSGVLSLSAEQAEFVTKSGKNELVPYRQVKSVGASGGMLVLTLFGGGSRSFAVSRELLDEVTGFVANAVAPFLAKRKEELLARGVYFSSEGPDGGALEILADRAEYKDRSGQLEGCVSFKEVRTVGVYGGSIEFALVDATTRSFPVEESLSAGILAFVQKAIEPYVAARTEGFDTAFGLDERIEFHPQRGVFHLILQGGREITGERPIESIVRCERVEDNRLTALGSVVSGGIGLIKSAAKAAGSGGAQAGEKIGSVSAVLTLRTEQGQENLPVCLGRSAVGMSRTDKRYEQCLAEWAGLADWLRARCPACELAEPALPEPEAAPETDALTGTGRNSPERADAAGAQEARAYADAALPRDDFGMAKYIDGVARFIQTSTTPMTIALQGNRGAGKNSVMGMLFSQMAESCGGRLFWLDTRQIPRGGSAGERPALVGRALTGLLSGRDAQAKQAGSLLTGLAGLATGIIAGDTAIGKEIAGGVFGKNTPAAPEGSPLAFSELVGAKIKGGEDKLVFFIDGLDQLDRPQAVDLLEAMRDFFLCKGCVFVVAANYREILLGARERYDEEKAKRLFDGLFRMTFRVPASSINLEQYAKGKLEALGIREMDEEEPKLCAALILHSIGRDLEAMDRLFVSFELLLDMMGGEVCEDRYKRLLLFALLCMQTSFGSAYQYAVRQKDHVTPEFLAGLCGETAQPWDTDLTGEEKAAYRNFGGVFAQIINLDDRAEISEAECRAFAGVLELSSVTSR